MCSAPPPRRSRSTCTRTSSARPASAGARTCCPSLVRNELAAGTVRIAFHSFAFIGPESEAAGRAAWAAGQQGRFWDMWATLYANQGLHENGGAFTDERLVAMADALHLDAARFAADFGSATAATWVADGAAEAGRAGVNSTPSLLIDGKAVKGGALRRPRRGDRGRDRAVTVLGAGLAAAARRPIRVSCSPVST